MSPRSETLGAFCAPLNIPITFTLLRPDHVAGPGRSKVGRMARLRGETETTDINEMAFAE